ncbi:MAG: endo-1,4-beta-xylanase [Phenylobacterium sp.]
MTALHRRGLIAGALALGACEGRAQPPPALPGEIAPLKAAAPFPVGVCAQVSHIDDPQWARLAARHFSQLTPEWEMKMEYIVQPDGSFRFDRPDQLASFARTHGMRLYGTTLVWYAQKPDGFVNLDESRIPFGRAYDNYITAVVARYRGQAAGWDVVNEPIAEDGHGWRESLWAEKLGDFDHMRRAFEVAHAADPQATLFLNDYNLESIPAKLDGFMRLAERLLKAGAPLGGLGCQTHLNADQQVDMAATLRTLAGLGLPVHLSELDVSVSRARRPLLGTRVGDAGQARLYAQAVEAFMALPPRQRWALTIWGLRDRDSWLRGENATDTPLLFDDAGAPKPAAVAVLGALEGGSLYGNEGRAR